MTEMISVQTAWEAAGGNPGITASADELLKALQMMDQAEDDVVANYLSTKEICAALGLPEMGKAELLEQLNDIRVATLASQTDAY